MLCFSMCLASHKICVHLYHLLSLSMKSRHFQDLQFPLLLLGQSYHSSSLDQIGQPYSTCSVSHTILIVTNRFRRFDHFYLEDGAARSSETLITISKTQGVMTLNKQSKPMLQDFFFFQSPHCMIKNTCLIFRTRSKYVFQRSDKDQSLSTKGFLNLSRKFKFC